MHSESPSSLCPSGDIILFRPGHTLLWAHDLRCSSRFMASWLLFLFHFPLSQPGIHPHLFSRGCLQACLSVSMFACLQSEVLVGKPRPTSVASCLAALVVRDPGAVSASRFSHHTANSFSSPVSTPTSLRFLTFVCPSHF